MSCVAEPTATNKAHQTTGPKVCAGSLSAIPTKPSMTMACANNNQLRLRPKRCVKKGMGMRSTSGAQTHLKP